MAELVSIDTVREKLSSPTEDVRLVALIHARAHGAAGQALALDVAKRFADESDAVAWQAMGAFAAIGAGAADAVPLLVEYIERGDSAMRVSRAFAALECIGQPARTALPAMLACTATERDPARSLQQLAAMLTLAPDDPRVIAAARARILADPGGAERLLGKLPAAVIDEVVAYALARRPEQAIRYLGPVAQFRRAAVLPVAITLLGHADPAIAKSAITIVRQASTLPPEAVVALVKLAGGGSASLRRHALDAIGKLAPAPVALEAAVAAWRARQDVVPSREAHDESCELKAAAETIGTYGDAAQIAMLTSWLATFPARARGAKNVNYYTMCSIVMAARPDPTIIAKLVELARTSEPFDSSAVGYFCDCVEGRTKPIESAKDIAAYKASCPAPTPPPLPDFPPEAPPRPAPVLESAQGHIYQDIQRRSVTAAALVETTLDAPPAEVVAAIGRFVNRAHREGTRVDVFSLAVLWGDAVARAVGWQWRELVSGEARGLAIASPDGKIACEVVDMFSAQLEKRDPTIVLLFNMIVAGELPETRPGHVVTLG